MASDKQLVTAVRLHINSLNFLVIEGSHAAKRGIERFISNNDIKSVAKNIVRSYVDTDKRVILEGRDLSDRLLRVVAVIEKLDTGPVVIVTVMRIRG
ncbi:MAG: DUF4258 domain-containing protein [Bdellovibrionota bacterium]